jgi:hypothetical protein
MGEEGGEELTLDLGQSKVNTSFLQSVLNQVVNDGLDEPSLLVPLLLLLKHTHWQPSSMVSISAASPMRRRRTNASASSCAVFVMGAQ